MLQLNGPRSGETVDFQQATKKVLSELRDTVCLKQQRVCFFWNAFINHLHVINSRDFSTSDSAARQVERAEKKKKSLSVICFFAEGFGA